VHSFTNLAKGYAQSLSNPYLDKTDLIINQLPRGLYGFEVAEKYNVPMMLASVILLAHTNTSLQALRSTVHEKISFFGDSSNQKPPGSLFSQSLAVFD
jgi:hypothetical protein